MDKKNFSSIVVENAFLKQTKSSQIIPPINLKSTFIYNHDQPYSNKANRFEISNVLEKPAFKNKIILEEFSNFSHKFSFYDLILTPKKLKKDENSDTKRFLFKDALQRHEKFERSNREQKLTKDFSFHFRSSSSNLSFIKFHDLYNNSKITKNSFTKRKNFRNENKLINSLPLKYTPITITQYKQIYYKEKNIIFKEISSTENRKIKQFSTKNYFLPIIFPNINQNIK